MERALALDAEAVGRLRRELVRALGPDMARTFLTRLGYEMGYGAALKRRELASGDDPWLSGAKSIPMVRALAMIEPVTADQDRATGRFEYIAEATDSLEATRPHSGGCWVLTGTLSGLASAFMGAPVYFDEESCAIQGGRVCRLVGRSVRQWGTVRAAELRRFLEEEGIESALRAEIRRREETVADLERSHAMLKAQQEAIPDGLLIVDTKGSLLEYNARFLHILKIPLEALGATEGGLDPSAWILDRVRDSKAFIDFMSRLQANPFESYQDEMLDLKDGTLLSSGTWPVVTSDGRLVARAWRFRDVTSQRAHETDQQHAQKMEVLGTLAGGIAHDFNNLLTGIGGHVALAMREVRQDGQAYKGLVIAHRAVERASDLTGSMLNFSRRTPNEPRPLDLREPVAETVKLLGRVIDPRITIETRTCDDLWRTLADPGQLNQLLSNLCVNARDAMSGGGRILIETANVTVVTGDARASAGQPPGEYVVMAVSDTGAGMSPEVIARIYEPFFTTKAEGKGTGLGLPIVMGIVHQHRAWIDCKSEPGRGTTFSVFFPREVGETAAEVEQQKRRTRGGSETILLVDDADLVRVLGQQVLEPLGYTVLLAEDGVEGLKLFRQNLDRVNLVILDMLMPRLAGEDVFRQMRELAPDLPIIISTGYATEEAFERLGTPGPVVCLNKPYMPRELARIVRDMLDYARISGATRNLPSSETSAIS
ncbi:MAG TPA: ATP-binding protein [Candidatus Polarisedimenticolia bacterium]